MSNLYRVRVRDIGFVTEWYQVIAPDFGTAILITNFLHIRKGFSELVAIEMVCKNWMSLI